MASFAVAALTAGALPNPCRAQPAAPLAYRRVYVSEGELSGQIRGLLPLRREEFERRLKLADWLHQPEALPAAARLESAIYRARHQRGQLVHGTAELKIVLHSPGPTILPLAPCGIAIESAVWRGEPERPAVLGVDPSGALVCLVEQSGNLQLTWTLRGQPLATAGTSLDLNLPASPRCRLEIETSVDEQLHSDDGLVTTHEPPNVPMGGRWWTIELGGRSQSRLTIRSSQGQSAAQPLVVVREDTTYSVLAASIDLETKLTLDVLQGPLGEVPLEIGPGLQVTAIRLGDQPLEWRTLAEPASEPARLAVALPAPLVGFNRPLQILATAEWPKEPRWPLPRVRIVGGVLQEGRVTIKAQPWLRLEVQPLAGCALTAVTPATMTPAAVTPAAVTPAAGGPFDQFQLQLYAAAAAVEIAADSRAAMLREQSGTDLRIDSTQVSGVLVAELSSLSGERYSVEAVLPRHWLIDAVETQPADMLADRVITPRGPGQQTLRLNLTRSLNEGRSLRLIVRAHFRRPAGQQPLPDDFFRLAAFPEAREGRRLLGVRVADPAVQLKLSGDEQLAHVVASQLSASELRLFETSPSGFLLAAGEGANADSDFLALRGTLVATSPQYRADVTVQAHAERGQVRQAVAIRCLPEASSVGSLLVRLTPRPTGAVTWRLSGEDDRELSAAVSEGAASDEAVYRLTLARPRTAPLELRGELPASGGEVCLAWLPEARSQTGLVEVYAPAGGGLNIAAAEVEPLPAASAPDGPFTTLRARYRYEAGRRARVRVAPANGRQAQPPAWVESLRLVSRFSQAGTGDHEVALHVVNCGLPELRLRLPAHVANLRAVDDGGAALDSLTRTVSGEVAVPLPAGERRKLVRLRYATSGPALGTAPWGTCLAPIPQLDLPVLSREWTVSLAPGLAALAERRNTALGPHVAITRSWAAPLSGRNWLARVGQPPAAAADRAGDLEWTGWTMLPLDLPNGAEASLAVYRPRLFQAWAICLGLAAASIALAVRGRLVHLVPLAGLIVAAACVMSGPGSWLVLGIAAGLVAGGAAELVRPGKLAPAYRAPRRPLSTVVLASAEGSSLLLLALLISTARTQAGEANQPLAAAKSWRVIMPVNNEQQPAGDYVYLEPELYTALHKLTFNASAALPAWVMESARYELPAAPRSESPRPAIDELRVQFDFQTFHPAATVKLPLRREQVSLVEGRARLDGQRQTLAWSAGGDALTLSVAEPGRHRLELVLGAAISQTAKSLMLDLTVPPAARAMAVFPAASTAEVLSTSGAEQPSAAGESRTLPLGGTPRLLVRWPDASVASDPATQFELDQLLWWRIRPGSAVVEGRFHLRPAGAPVRELVLAVDPRLTLLPPDPATSRNRRVVPVEGAPQLLRVDLSDPAADGGSVLLSWLWPDVVGTGTLVLPRVAAQSGRLRKSWIAVSVEPQFVVDAEAAQAPTAAEFVPAWGDAAAAPTLVRTAPAEPNLLTLRVLPRPTQPLVEQAVDWCLSATAASAVLAARLTGVDASRLSHRLSLPPQLKVRTVDLRQNGRAARIRWTQHADGQLAIGLLEPAAYEQQLTVQAELPLAPRRLRQPLPNLRLDQTAVGPMRMRIFRQEDARIVLQDPAGWTRQDDPQLGNHFAGLGRLVAVLQSGGAIGDRQPRVNRAPNEPRLSGMLFIRVQEDDGDWRAEAELDLAVAGGVLDQVRLSVPAQWSGPLSIEPAVEHQLTNAPEQPRTDSPERRVLRIRPQQAAQDRLRLTIRGPLASGPIGIQAPDIVLLDSAQVERMVLLDANSGGEPIVWETTGLTAAAAADGPLPDSWQAADGRLLRAVAPHFTATARIQPAVATQPRVVLADISAQLAPRGRVALSSTFTIHPHGATECVFQLPPGWRLVQVQLDSVLAQAAPAGLRTWRVAAPSTQLPYRLTIASDGWLPAEALAGGRLALAAPQLVRMSTGQTAWSVTGAEANQRPSATTGAAAASPPLAACLPADVELLRLEAATSGCRALEDSLATDLPAVVQSGSFGAWWRLHQGALARLGAFPNPTARIQERREAAVREAQHARQKLIAVGVVDPEDVPQADGDLAAELSAAGTLCFSAADAAPELSLALPRPPATWTRAHWAWSIAGASLLLWAVMQLTGFGEWLADQAHLLLAAAGVAWWLLAPFGAAGWILVLAGVWLAVRWPWPRGGYSPAQGS